MKKMCSILLVPLVIAVFLPLMGCGSSKKDSAAGPGSVEIRVAWWGDTKRHELYNKICDAFQAENPGITLVREPTSWADYWDKLTVQSAGGSAPDFMGMHPQYANDFVRRGVLEPLDPYIKEGAISLADFSEGSINSGIVDGIDYMIPMGITGQSFIVNETALAELGLPKPAFDWTWDDLAALGAKARVALDKAGKKEAWLLDDNIKNYQLFRYWVRQNGRELFTAGGDIGFTADDAATWFEYWKDLQKARITPDAATAMEYFKATLEESLIAKGRVLIRPVPANQYKLYCLALPQSTLSMVRNPSKTGGKPGEFTEGAHFSISAKTSDVKKAAAAKLINFWVNTETSMSLFGMDQGVPGNQRMAEFIKPKLDQYQLAVMDYMGKFAQVPMAPTVYPPTGASEIDALYQSTAEQVAFGVKSAKEAGEELVAAAQAVADKNKKK